MAPLRFDFVEPILWGGIAYSIGAVLEFVHWPVLVPGVVQWHEVFHIAVLIGLGFHWAFVYAIADGKLLPTSSALDRQLIHEGAARGKPTLITASGVRCS